MKGRKLVGLSWLVAFAGCFGVGVQVHAQTWSRTVAPYQRHMNDAAILSQDRLIICGGNQTNDAISSAFSSSDVGLYWEINHDVLFPWIKACAFYDTLGGVAVGDAGGIKRTANGGFDWSDIASPTSQNINDVFFVDSAHGYAVGGLYDTEDTTQTSLFSSDGGQTWSITSNQGGHPLESVYFIDENNGIAVGPLGTIVKTVNGGQDWSSVTSPIIRDFNTVEFTDASTGYIVGGRFTNDSIRTILKSVNGGGSWTVLMDEPGGWLKDINFLGEDTAYAVGDVATVLKTTNAGVSWTPYALPETTGQERFNVVKFSGQEFGMIAGNSGVVYVLHNIGIPEVETLQAIVQPSETEILFQGTVNTFGAPAQYSFVFDTDPTLTNFSAYLPENITSTEAILVERLGTFFDPATTYYYCIRANTIGGVVYGDTLSITTTIPYTELSLDTVLNQETLLPTFGGTISGFIEEAQLFFEYGSTPLMGTEVTADPAVITDGAVYSPTYTFGTPLTNGLYYVRLKAVTPTSTYYSGTRQFLSGEPFDVLEMVSVSYDIATNVASFEGFATNVVTPSEGSFIYGGQSQFGSIPSSPQTINDTLDHTVTAAIDTLLPNNMYQVSFHLSNQYGAFESNTMNLYTGVDTSGFKTETATQITPTSSILNAYVADLNYPSDISFDYGTTTQFGLTVTGNPAQILNDEEYFVSSQLNDLEPNTLYYYRLKGTSSGIDFLGDTRQFFTGPPEIPNWDFQDWEDLSIEIPVGWNIMEDNFEKLDMDSGNSALKMLGANAAIMGYLVNEPDGPPNFNGVTPFPYRPDSVYVEMDFNVEPNDTVMILVLMDSADINISFNVLAITGTSGGIFSEYAFPISYNSPSMPENISIVALTFNIANEVNLSPNNYLAIDSIHFGESVPVIEAAKFDEWLSYDFQKLNDWTYFKYLDAVDGNTGGPSSVLPVVVGVPNDSAARVRSLMRFGNVEGGEIRTGLDNFGDQLIPIDRPHEVLTGYMSFDRQGTDTLQVDAQLSQNGEFIGYSTMNIVESIPELTAFELKLHYNSWIPEPYEPDSINIDFRIRNHDNVSLSEMVINNLGFDGFYVGEIDSVPDAVPEFAATSRPLAFPNPTSGELNLSAIPNGAMVELWSLDGKRLDEIENVQPNSKMDLSGYSKGIYLLRIFSDDKSFSQRIVIIKSK